MRKVKILFFAADPLSSPPNGYEPRLRLDDDVREIRVRVRAAEHREALEFDYRLAARPADLLQALNETQPQVVHFSGHGGSEGLVLVDPQGRGANYVDAAALSQLFQAFRGGIRVVVLNACFSLPQAEAIMKVVGCAIGTSRPISDAAAITFGSSFYSALAFGRSVKAAFEQACAELALSHPAERDCPRLLSRRDVDPGKIRLVPSARRTSTVRKLGFGATALAAAALAAFVYLPRPSRPGSVAPTTAASGAGSSPSGKSSPVDSIVGPGAQPAAAPAPVDSAYRPPPVDDAGNLVRNGGFENRFAEWTRSLQEGKGKGTNEIVSFADARSGYGLHLTYEGTGGLVFAQKIPVSGPDYVFRGTFRASAHEGPMIGFSGTGTARVTLQYMDANGDVLGITSLNSYVANPLASTPLVGVPRRGNGGNAVHYVDVEKNRLYKDFELDVRREVEENLLAVVPGQIRTIAIALYCGANDDGAGAELWASDLSLRPKH